MELVVEHGPDIETMHHQGNLADNHFWKVYNDIHCIWGYSNQVVSKSLDAGINDESAFSKWLHLGLTII